jgi:TonB family protein
MQFGDLRGRNSETALLVEILQIPSMQIPLPNPPLRFIEPVIDPPPLPALRFEDDIFAQSSSNSVIPFIPPRLDPELLPDSSSYAAQAGLSIGSSATVLFALDISDTGFVTAAFVQKSSGNAQVDAAAIEYAKTLRWIPGTMNGSPHAMRIRFATTLTRRA